MDHRCDVDRRALNVLLAVLDVDRRDLAERMGYERKYVVNVLNGFTPASPSFRRAFGDAITELLLGTREPRRSQLPAEPLVEFVRKRSETAERKCDFWTDLGLSPSGLHQRHHVSLEVVDRVCCKLGIHPTQIYGRAYEEAV